MSFADEAGRSRRVMASSEVDVVPGISGENVFRLPREPQLHWRLLNPWARRRPMPAPFQTKPTVYFFWARNALFHGLRVLGLRPGDEVLVPAFHCASLIDPLLHHGARVGFYQIDTDGSPDLRDIETRIGKHTRAVLAIHYFGFPRLICELRELCTRRGLFLIEDCAHVLSGDVDGAVLGEFGDISVFSWRKFFPVYDGGQLVVNNPALAPTVHAASLPLLLRIRIWKDVVDRVCFVTADGKPRTLSRIARRLSTIGRTALGFGDGGRPSLTIDNHSTSFDAQSVDFAMSTVSRRMLLAVDVRAVVEARRRHYRMLLEAFADVPEIVPLFGQLPPGVCPWVFPFTAKRRGGFHLALRAQGIPATTWGSVIHRALPLHEFPGAAFLYENLVFLPIHQDLSRPQIELMVDVILRELSRTE